MDPSSPNKSMDQKPNPDPHTQQPIRCPRCDSSNTKFCYYNNYSLSQPRHFCKACKRYWTRGGTLRNVPVGGGCRKNKRVKRPTPGGDVVSSAVTSHVPPPPIDLSPVSNSLFYNLPTNPLELNSPFSRLSSNSSFDFGLGFSSGLLTGQDFNDPSVYLGSGNSSGSTTSTMASLLASLQQQKFGLMPCDPDYQGRGENGISNEREVKMEGENNNRLGDQYQNNNQIHYHDQQINDANNSSLIWNTSNICSWFDPNSNNMGSSVPSHI